MFKSKIQSNVKTENILINEEYNIWIIVLFQLFWGAGKMFYLILLIFLFLARIPSPTQRPGFIRTRFLPIYCVCRLCVCENIFVSP